MDIKYNIKGGKLVFLFKIKNITIKKFLIKEKEYKYIDSFLKTYHALNKTDRDKINLLSKKYTLYRCWYYSKVWFHTRENIKQMNINSECIDHILPITRGFKNNIAPELIASLENIQFITHKENLHKGIKLTSKGKELLFKYTS